MTDPQPAAEILNELLTRSRLYVDVSEQNQLVLRRPMHHPDALPGGPSVQDTLLGNLAEIHGKAGRVLALQLRVDKLGEPFTDDAGKAWLAPTAKAHALLTSERDQHKARAEAAEIEAGQQRARAEGAEAQAQEHAARADQAEALLSAAKPGASA